MDETKQIKHLLRIYFLIIDISFCFYFINETRLYFAYGAHPFLIANIAKAWFKRALKIFRGEGSKTSEPRDRVRNDLKLLRWLPGSHNRQKMF